MPFGVEESLSNVRCIFMGAKINIKNKLPNIFFKRRGEKLLKTKIFDKNHYSIKKLYICP